MQRLIHFLSLRPKLNMFLALVYFLLVVLPHEQVGLLTVKIFGHLTRDRYNAIILVMGIVLLLLYLAPIIKAIFKRPNRGLLFLSLVSSVIFSVIAFRILVIINIEIVHFFQYGVMAVLLFPLLKNFGQTLFAATILGAIDEAYQYFYLAPERTDYYDFNDVIINLLGATFGLLFVAAIGIENEVKNWRWVWYTLLSFSVLFVGLYMADFLHIYPKEDGVLAPIMLNRTGPTEGFWSVIHPQVTYHIVQPLEGLLVTGGLLVYYSWLFRRC